MKLPIKKKYFDQIKLNIKTEDYRDAHITFVCEETGERLQRKVINVKLEHRPKKFYPEVLEDDYMIVFEFNEG